jgi:hypothetical protein
METLTMFWDGTRWIDETLPTPARPSRRLRARDLMATGIMVMAVVGLAVPTLHAEAAVPRAGRALIEEWTQSFQTATYQETSRRVSFDGRWIVARHKGYLGGAARSSDTAGARVSIVFTGSGISWIGPVGPTRGQAAVYIDGKRVATVNTYNGRFQPGRALFTRTFAESGRHRLTIRVLGTRRHPTVAVDSFVVRGGPKGDQQPKDPNPTPAPTQTTEPTSAPTPTAATVTDPPVPTAAPTGAPAPTVAPTPPPTPAPTTPATATPNPVSAGRPFAPPATTRTVSVPSSIDATGVSDVSAALNSFVASVPNGSVIAFKAGGTYRLGAGIRFTNRHHLVFEGNGATLRPTGQTDNANNSAFALWGSNTDITIRNFTVIGQNSRPGVYNSATNENRFGILVWGGARVEIANVTMLNIWADYVGLGGQLPSSGSDMIESDDIWIHDSNMTGGGRMGISAVATTHVLIERNTFDLTAWSTLDIEPNTFDNEVGWITFRDNIIKRGGSGPSTDPAFVSARGGVNTPNVHDITITGNRTNGTLRTDIDHPSRRRNVVFAQNVALTSESGPVLKFAYIDGLTVSGNVQPLTSGSLASITGSTSVVSR